MTSQSVHVLVFDGLPIGSRIVPADDDLWFDMFKHGRLPQSAI
jgi:hypothetical protein